MKKRILSVALILSVAFTSVFANGGSDPEAVFKKEFPSAQLISWNKMGDLLKAVFLLDGHRTEAYFQEDGHFLGSSRAIFFDQLPLAASRALDKKYANANYIEIYEITNDEGTQYRIRLEQESKTYRIRVDGNGNITDSDRIKK
ncbi:MAG: hypothetical protein IPQ08_08485 [Chitinophagaceae bacterium]|nr:hypothetical protein [Chitinophagaceae bacterium]